ncbi:hypothetical protein PSCLAVI8L_360005 [Pseudoclavibacter sp. 8L]|nr:hypothetical protein PSCLAVI8L_360005 [Pseudoclavibacter sp. 8L]
MLEKFLQRSYFAIPSWGLWGGSALPVSARVGTDLGPTSSGSGWESRFVLENFPQRSDFSIPSEPASGEPALGRALQGTN